MNWKKVGEGFPVKDNDSALVECLVWYADYVDPDEGPMPGFAGTLTFDVVSQEWQQWEPPDEASSEGVWITIPPEHITHWVALSEIEAPN